MKTALTEGGASVFPAVRIRTVISVRISIEDDVSSAKHTFQSVLNVLCQVRSSVTRLAYRIPNDMDHLIIEFLRNLLNNHPSEDI